MAITKDAASLRKRAQITKANKVMFLWVAGASVIVSASIVVGIMLVQKGLHQQKALKELRHTVSVLEKNSESVPELENQLRALGSNQALLDLRRDDTGNALSVILDALPADANPSALGASLQTKLFRDVEVESVQVMPLGEGGEAEATDEEGETDAASTDSKKPQSIAFQFSVRGSSAQLKSLMTRLEKSIRTIQITSMRIEGGDGKEVLSVEGNAFYLPATVLELRNKEIKR